MAPVLMFVRRSARSHNLVCSSERKQKKPRHHLSEVTSFKIPLDGNLRWIKLEMLHYHSLKDWLLNNNPQRSILCLCKGLKNACSCELCVLFWSHAELSHDATKQFVFFAVADPSTLIDSIPSFVVVVPLWLLDSCVGGRKILPSFGCVTYINLFIRKIRSWITREADSNTSQDGLTPRV